MSEFSESYHLRSERAEDACEVLRQLGLAGFVFPPTRGWVTFVVEGDEFVADQRLVAAVRRPLLHFVSAEEHGWGFTFFENAQVVCAYRASWDDEVQFDDSRYARATLDRLLPEAKAAALDALEQEMRATDYEELFDSGLSAEFAQAIGLEHYDWLAYRYLEKDWQRWPDRFRGVIQIK